MSDRLQLKVAEEVRVILTRQRRSGSWLAREAGVNQSWMSGRLTGRTPMTVDDLELIAKTLDVPLTRLIGFEDGQGGQYASFKSLAVGVAQARLPAQALIPRQATTAELAA